MKRIHKILLAVICLVGGWGLTTPAGAQSEYPSCEELVRQPCSGPTYVECTRSSGVHDWLMCYDGYWVWA